MSMVPHCVVECWLRAADDHLRQREPSEHDYILAMMCANHAWEHCDGIFLSWATIDMYRGLCNESLAKEDVALGLWGQALFSAAEAAKCYHLAKLAGCGRWEEQAADRGLLRCSVMRKQVLEAWESDAASRKLGCTMRERQTEQVPLS